MTDANGLYYMRARYYSPELKRFVNADIVAGDISNAITLNRYAYANGNPVSNIDPFGLSADEGRGNSKKEPLDWSKATLGEMWLDTWEYLKEEIKKRTSPELERIKKWLTNATNSMGEFLENTFGAGASTGRIDEYETPSIFDTLSPIVFKSGSRSMLTSTNYGDSSKPISVYAYGDTHDPIGNSSAGLNINIADFTLKLNLGLSDISLSGSLTNGDTTHSLGAKVDLLGLRAGFEGSTTTRLNPNYESEVYSNASINGWPILFFLVFVTTGQYLEYAPA